MLIEESCPIHLSLVIVLAVVGIAIVVGAIVVSRTKTVTGSGPNYTAGSSGRAERPDSEAQCSLVRERVARYREELLRYQLRLERDRRSAPGDVLLKLLAGEAQVMSRPILYLNSDEWKWDQQRLQDAVTRTLGELGLRPPTGVREPTSQAERACDAWAVAEARRQFDQLLGSDGKG